ncbi:MAG: hypothetical protein ACRENZ_09795, partial [Thermodesulfobacteriota bacterium]
MPIFETLTLILTSETAIGVAKFLYEKVEGYVREKFGNKPPDEDKVIQLKKEIEDLKDRIESKGKGEIPLADVEELRERITQIEKNQTPLPSTIISPDIFQKWTEEGELDVEDQALIIRKELEILLDRADDLGIKDRKRFQIQDILSSINVNVSKLKSARMKARISPLPEYTIEEERREILLNNTIP